MRYVKILLVPLFLCAAEASAYEPAGTPADWPGLLMDARPFGMLLSDRLEAGFADEVDSYDWDIQGWYGGDRNRLWMKTEGEGAQGDSPDDAELQLLFGRMFAPFWDLQIGVRHDFRPRPDRSHLVFGVQGVVPYEFEIDSALFLSDSGDVTARFEAEYDLRLTQRLIVQPRFELNAASSADRAIGLDSGLNDTELGLRLRYEFRREFAPYIGVSWKRLYAGTADLARGEGDPASATSLVLGVRAWF